MFAGRRLSLSHRSVLRLGRAFSLSKEILKEKYKQFNATRPIPEYFPAGREREIAGLLEAVVGNWGTEGDHCFKITIPTLAQGHGAGKTFLAKHLPYMLSKAMGADDLSPTMAEVSGLTSTPFASTTVLAAAKKSVRGYRCIDEQLHRVDALANVRTIELTANDILGALHESNLDRAILVAAAGKILGRSVSDGTLHNELEQAGLKELHELCDVLTADDGAMLLSLDDFTDLFDDHSERAKGLYYGHPPNAKDVMCTVHATLEETMRKPGVAIVLSGRTPSMVYEEWQDCAPTIYVGYVEMDALSKKDIINILCKSQRGDRFLRDELNLTTDRHVHDLACCLLRYTGGHGRVVECALKALEQDGMLQQRPSGQGVPDVLTDAYMANFFNEHIKLLNIFPIGIDVPTVWNKKKTMSSLVSVMHEARFQGEGMVSEEKWVQVLANASEREPHMEHLEVRRDTRYFNMANQHRELGMPTVKLIAQRCPKLRSVRMVNEFQDTAVSVMAIFLRECPLIESIAVGHLEVVLTTRVGVRMCSVSSNSGEVVWFNALVDALDVPVWKLSLPYVYLHHKHLQRLADKHGGTLSFFKLKLEDAVTDAMWDQFAVKCSQITVLCLSMSEGLSNASYALLSKRFPKLSEIAIATKSITDADMAYLLDQFQQNGHVMKAFDLSGCKELTDATVLKIVALFPDLLLLGLYVTKVTEQLLLDLILTKRLRARQLTHMHSYWIEMRLIEASISPRPIFNSFGRG